MTRCLVIAALLGAVWLLNLPARGEDGPPEGAEVAQAEPGTGAKPPQKPAGDEERILELDLERLGQVPVRVQRAEPTATGSVVTPTGAGAGPSSIGEVLESAPGVSVRRTSGINLDPRVRGFHSGQLNASANSLTQLKTRVDIDSLFSQIDPGNVRSIQVIEGPYTALYGPGFAFLVADLMQPSRYAGGFELHGLTSFSHGSNGREIYNRDQLWGGDAESGFHLSYGFRTANDYRGGGDAADFRVPASYHHHDVFVALSRNLGEISRVDFNYLRLDLSDVELAGVAYDLNRSSTDQLNVRYVVQEEAAEPERLVLQFWAQRTAYDADAGRESKQLTFNGTLLANPFPGINVANPILAAGVSESAGTRALTTLGDRHGPQLTLGADWRYYKQSYVEADFAPDGSFFFGDNLFGIPSSNQQDVGVLAQLQAPLSERLKVTVGGRVDRASSHVDNSDPITRTPVLDPAGFFRPGFVEPTDTLGMAYVTAELKPREWLTLNVGAAYAMRSASLAELYSDEPFVPLARFGNSYVDGNSALDPERNFQLDLGARGEWDGLSLGARGFHSRIHDYILAVPSDFSSPVPAGVNAPTNLQRNTLAFGLNPNDPTINFFASTHSLAYRYSNLDRVVVYGGEVFGEVELLDGLSLHGTLAYVRGINHSPVRFVDATGQLIAIKESEALPNIYPLNATIGLRLFEPGARRWSLRYVIRLVDAQTHVAESLGELPTPGFVVSNLYASYQVNDRLRFFSAIENLFDRTYTEHGSLVLTNQLGQITFVKEPGFSWTFGFEARF